MELGASFATAFFFRHKKKVRRPSSWSLPGVGSGQLVCGQSPGESSSIGEFGQVEIASLSSAALSFRAGLELLQKAVMSIFVLILSWETPNSI